MDFKIHDGACHPTEGGLKGEYYPCTPQGNLFAFESEDKFVLTCAPDQAIVYQACHLHRIGLYNIQSSVASKKFLLFQGQTHCANYL